MSLRGVLDKYVRAAPSFHGCGSATREGRRQREGLRRELGSGLLLSENENSCSTSDFHAVGASTPQKDIVIFHLKSSWSELGDLFGTPGDIKSPVTFITKKVVMVGEAYEFVALWAVGKGNLFELAFIDALLKKSIDRGLANGASS